MKFPRTWEDIRTSPWLDSVEPKFPGDPYFVHIKSSWLPPRHEVSNSCSAIGYTLKEVLSDLRTLWPYINPPPWHNA